MNPPPPCSNTPLIVPQNPPINIEPGYPSQQQIHTKPGPYYNQISQNNQIIQNQVPIINQPSLPTQYGYIQSPIIQIPISLEIGELFRDLGEINEAEVWKYYQGGSIFKKTCKYRVKIKYKNGSDIFIFIGKKETNCCFRTYYFFDIRMKYIPRDCTDEILNTSDFNKRHFDISSSDLLGCNPKIFIKNVESNMNLIIGCIEQRRCFCNCCCRDPHFYI